MKESNRMQEHNRQRTCYRITEGIKTAVHPPFLGMLPILALVVFLYVALCNRGRVFDTSVLPGQLATIANYIELSAIIAIFFVFLFAAVYALGTPSKRKNAESAAFLAFRLQSEEECPILISSKRQKNGARRWEFFSQWETMTDWQENIDRICHALGEHLVGELNYGGKRNNNRQRIVFYTKPGAAPVKRGDLRDNEF